MLHCINFAARQSQPGRADNHTEGPPPVVCAGVFSKLRMLTRVLQHSSLGSVLGAVVMLCTSAVAGPPAASVALTGTTEVARRPEPDVVVWLEAPNAPRSLQAKKVVLDQRNLSFAPRVVVVRVGTRVELPNNDRVFHNVFSFHDGKRFDLGLYPVGTARTVTFDQPGLSRIFCNIHPNMTAYVMVVDTPYFALSDRNGEFEIPSVTPGAYRYHAWRARGPELTGPAMVQLEQRLNIHWP